MSNWLKYGRDRRNPASSVRDLAAVGAAALAREPGMGMEVLLRLESGGGRRHDDASVDVRALRVALTQRDRDRRAIDVVDLAHVQRIDVATRELRDPAPYADTVLDRVEMGMRPITSVRSGGCDDRTQHDRLLAMAAAVRSAYGLDPSLRTMPRRRVA